jgi:hypothetical protein
MPRKIILPQGLKINNIEFIEDLNISHSDGKRICLLKCHCGKKFKYATSRFNKGKVKSCGCLSKSKLSIINKYYTNENYSFTIIINKILKCKNKIDKNGKSRVDRIGFDLTEDQIKSIWIKQNGKCFYTGIKLILPNSYPESYNEFSPSIDRIDSNKPYTISNVQIVHKKVNFMKQAMTHDEFILFCKLINDNFQNHKE